MKQIRLLELELTNYRNIDHEVYVFGGKNAKIVGENRIGKTNTLEAIYFLFSNYLLDGSNDLTALKPLADTKKVVSVKGTFLVDDKEISIEKRYAENWVKKRGTTEVVLDGHYEEYFFNTVKQDKAKAYYDLLEEHFGVRNDSKGEVDVIQMLTNPLYLGNLGDSKDWTILRNFIIKIIGDVTNEEVFIAEPTTLLVKEDMEKALNNVEQVKKQYANGIKDLEQKITADNANIEMLEKTPKPSDEEVAVAQKGIEEHQNEIARLQSSIGTNAVVETLEKQVVETKKQVLDLNTREFTAFQASKTDPNADVNKQIADVNAEISDYIEKKMSVNSELQSMKNAKTYNETMRDGCVKHRQELIDDLRATRAEIANVDNLIQTECPTCHRPLEASDIDNARQEFIESHKFKEQNIIDEGKANTQKMQDCEAKLKEIDAQIAVYEKDLADIEGAIATRRNHINELKAKLVVSDSGAFVESDELKALRKKLADLEEQLRKAREEDSQANTSTAQLIAKEKEAIVPFQKVIDDKAYYDRQMQVLNAVRAQREGRNKELADLEQKKECLNLFTFTKLRLLNEHTAKVFGNIRFQLIKENLNGGFDPVCKPYIYDVDKDASTNTIWKSGSKSEKIVTGIAIAEAIKKELGLTELPYLFDEGGEISTDTFSTKFKTDAQIICVKVEDNIFKPVVVNF